MATATGIRARNRAAIEAEILTAAARSLAEVGAAGLSLRALARELGMVPSALYRYFASRDDLLTRLIVASFDSLGDAVDAALASAAHDSGTDDPAAESSDPATRFSTIAHATRDWARGRPHEYALLYGTPVPRYHAPADVTNPAGTRVQARLLDVLATLGPTEPPSPAARAAAQTLEPLLSDPLLAPLGLDPTVVLRGTLAWNLVLGSITAELFEWYGPEGLGEPDAYFEAVVEAAFRVVRGAR